MNTRTILFILVIGASLGMGCSAGARVVRTDAGGGQLELWGPTGTAAARGREALLDHCGGAYVVNARGADLGLGRAEAAPSRDATAIPSGEHVTFQCKGNAPKGRGALALR